MELCRSKRCRSSHASSRQRRSQSVALSDQGGDVPEDQQDQIRHRLRLPEEQQGQVAMVTVQPTRF